MGARRLTNEDVAKAAGVATRTVSAVRNGKDTVTLPSLKAVAEAVGLSVEISFVPLPGANETSSAVAP